LPVRSERPLGLEGAFASREEAMAFHSEMEKKAAARGNRGPLHEYGTVEGLLTLSDFEEGVFRDWLIDHGIPDPEPFARKWRAEESSTPIAEWLEALTNEQLADLYAALHRFRFYEVVEVPFVPDHYPEEQWGEWEKNLPPDLPANPEDEYDGFRYEEGGFTAEPCGWPAFESYVPVEPLGSGPWAAPPEGPPDPWFGDVPPEGPPEDGFGPPSPNDDEIPF
jgi:hypothetical protein